MAKRKTTKAKPAKLTKAQREEFFRLRKLGMHAEGALNVARRHPSLHKWTDESGPTFKRTSFEHEGFTVHASLEYDECCNSRLDDLGEFTRDWQSGAVARFPDDEHPRRPMNIRNGRRRSRKFYDSHSLRFFVPSYTIEERRKDLNAAGYSKGVADFMARSQVYEDAEKAVEVQTACLDVVVFKNGIELARNSLGGMATDEEDYYLDECLTDYDTLREAIAEAKETLKGLCGGGCKGKRSKVTA